MFATGAAVVSHFPPRVFINSQGPFVNQTFTTPNGTATFSFSNVPQADYTAVLLAHELGHTMNESTISRWNPLGSFPPDSHSSAFNATITQNVIARCF